MIYLVSFLGGCALSLAFDMPFWRFVCLIVGICCIAWVVTQW